MTITDEMIEAAAKVLCDLNQGVWSEDQARWKLFARAALTAVLPMMDGWQPIADYKDDGLEREFLVAEAGGWVTAATWAKTKYHGDGWLDGGDFANRDLYTARPLRGITHFRPLPPPTEGRRDMTDEGTKIGPTGFRARMLVENPSDIQMTLKLTMSMKDWEALRDTLATEHPAWMLSSAITDMLSAARKTYYPSEETP